MGLIKFHLLIAASAFLLNACNEPRVNVNVDFPASLGAYGVSTVEVSVTESQKFVANEFVTVAIIELRGTDKNSLFKQLDTRRTSIFLQMNDLDIAKSDIEQNSADMRKEWDYSKGKRNLVGYVVSQSFAIKSSSKATAIAVVAALSAEQDVEIMRTSANLKDEESLQSNVIQLAGKKAQKRANDYAKSVNCKVKRVLSISSDGYSNNVLNARSKSFAYDVAMAAGTNNSSVADSVEITASIKLVVEIETIIKEK